MKHTLLFILLIVYSAVEVKSRESEVPGENASELFSLSGTVYDESGETLIGAQVVVKSREGAVALTDAEGNFVLPSMRIGDVVKFSYVGCKPVEITVTSKTSKCNVVLYSNQTQLDEVVVVGYATQKRANLTGAVSTVSMTALSDRPVTNATNALAGLASGLTVTNTGGNTPGFESQNIRIRGQGTLNDAAPLVVVDGQTGIAISDIAPQDIDNISILKDAASAAIYGSRAANGVILITTKHGVQSAPRLTYSGNVSFETVAKRLNLVTDYADFMEIQNYGLTVNGQAPRFSQGKIDEWRNDAGRNPTIYPNTDWQDHIYRNPNVVQNHNLSVTGGGRRARYNLSFGYVNNPGIIYYTDYERFHLRSTVDVNIQPWLSVGCNLFGYIDKNNPSSENAAAGGDVIFGSGAFNTVPGMTLYDPVTGLYGGIQNPEDENVSNFNPYRRQWFYDTDYPTKTKRTVTKLYGRLTPVKGLTVEGSFSYNQWERNIEHHLTDRDLYRFTAEG
ncbi:MAG: SusC/RagA family TonB-linked outer membrane protein, partial [Muribaculaceae bacterium]|nr:SusC/RagA family TonB-linked outer membrane protein [Muribaculaceae bacterium]